MRLVSRLISRVAVGAILIIPLPAAMRPDSPSGLARSVAKQQAADTLVGTIRTLDLAKRELTVITGVGLALRIVPFVVAAETRATAEGAAIAMSELQPGDVVRVIGGRRAEGRVAYVIERLPGGRTGPARTR
jgi:hypothetical protein